MKRDYVYLLVIFSLLFVCFHLWNGRKSQGILKVIDVDTIVTQPIATDSQLVGMATVSVPKRNVDVTKLEKSVQNEVSTEEIIIKDAGGDSLMLEIPITQKVYEDSLYTAWVSGYMAKLDSVRIRERTVFMVEKSTEAKKRKIGFGVVGGVGLVGLNGRTGGGWFLGVGLTVPL